MEEKILIKSEKYDVKKLFKVLLLVGLALSVVMAAWSFVNAVLHPERFSNAEVYSKAVVFAIRGWWSFFVNMFWVYLIPVVVMTCIATLIYVWLKSYELTITDKRVYGKVAFGKRVDLPVDSVSATSTISLFKGVSVSTSSGKISFLAIKNTNEIYEVINNLLIERQKNKPKTETTIVQNSDEADKLKKYKDLLDSGVITQEEFDAKKKQLLGL